MTSLGDRMKGYEALTRTHLPGNSFYALRVDGKNFSTYTRGLVAPFDEQFASDMDAVTRELCKSVSGALIGYTQSDEISVIFSDLASPTTEAHQGGSVLKITSLSAALATACFNELRPGHRALFDSRVFALPSAAEVANYLLWRQKDATRNSVSMAARVRFSHRDLHQVSTEAAKAKLLADGVNWDDYPAGFRLGRTTTKVTKLKPTSFIDRRSGEKISKETLRSEWVSAPSDVFSADPEGPLMQSLLSLPLAK